MRFHLSHLYRLAFEMVRSASKAHRRVFVCARFAGRSRRAVVGRYFVEIFRKPGRGIPRAAPQRTHHDLHCREPAPPNVAVRYPQSVSTPSPSERSPASGLLLGLVITLAVVVAYSAYIRVQLAGLASCRTDMWTPGAKDRRQCLRRQNNFTTVALPILDCLVTAN